MEEIKTYFYGCLKFKTGYLEKKRFETRDEARNFITKNFNPEIHEQCWTE